MNPPHLDDELLSASLDGEAGPAAAAHLAACEACRSRLDALDGARRAVASSPPGPPPGVADRAVAAAVEAWSAERSGSVVPLRERAGARRGGRAVDGPHPAPVVARRRLPGWALGVAAAVAALLVAVPLIAPDGNGPDTEQTASAPARDSSAKAQVAAEEGAVDGGDLGEQTDVLALRRLLGDAVAGSADPGTDLSAAPAAPPEAAVETRRRSADDAAPAGGAGTTVPAGPQAAVPPAGAPAPSAPARACADVVRSTFGTGLGPLVYSASLRWQGGPAVVLAYRLADTSGPGPDHRAFVMAQSDCRLLVVQGF